MTGTNGESLKEILESIDKGETQLPDFQRGWVWEDKRIRALIASITNNYPIGAAMFLEYAGSEAHFKYRLFEGVDQTISDVKPRYLVLDGQQRSTSLYRSIFSKKIVETCDNNKKAIKRFYYLNIPKCLDTLTDRIDAVVSVPENKIITENIGRDIVLDLSSSEKEYAGHHFPLNIVFDTQALMQWQMGYWQYHNSDQIVIKQRTDFFTRVITPITSFRIPLIILGNDVPKEAVCQVFENVNQGGVSLTVFELVTATFAADNFELRKDWNHIWNNLKKENIINFKNNQPSFSGVDFLTAITLLSSYYKTLDKDGVGMRCKKRDVLSLKLEDYIKYKDVILDGLSEAIKFIKQQGIYTCIDLPYSSQLIPLVVLFAIDKNLWFGAANKRKLEQWYWCGVFGELYGGANDTRYVNDVQGMLKWLTDDEVKPETVVRSNFNYSRLQHLYTRNSAAYKGVMALILKNGAVDFICGGKMDFATYVDEATDIHHIFPQSECIRRKIDRSLWNSVINKTPIYARSNRSIGGDAPSVYLARIEKKNKLTTEQLNGYVQSHLADVNALRTDDFDTYYKARAQSLCDLIERATGKPVDGRRTDVTIEDIQYVDEDED